MRARRTPPTTPAEEPLVSLSSWTEGEASGSSEAEFGAREDLGWGSGSLLEVASVLVVVVGVVVVVVVVGTLCVVGFAAVGMVNVDGLGVAVVDGVVGVVGSCTLT